jgi:battenin
MINSNSSNDENEYELTSSRDLSTKQMNRCITAFSSGTGLAGIVGYGYKSLLSETFGWGLSSVVFSVVVFAAAYYAIFYHGLFRAAQDQFDQLVYDNVEVLTQKAITPVHMLESSFLTNTIQQDVETTTATVEMVGNFQENTLLHLSESTAIDHLPAQLTPLERFRLVLSLWPYTIPLFTVYAAEYMMQVR